MADYREMNWDSIETDDLYAYIDKLPIMEQLQFFNWLRQHYPELDIDWLSIFEDLRDLLSNKDNIAACEEFVSWFPEFRPEIYADNYEFIERDLCDYYIYTNDLAKLKERINFIQKNPVAGIDILTIRLYYQLLYNGFYNEASEYAEAIYNPILESELIWGNPQEPLLLGMYLDRLQQVYHHYKESGEFKEDILNKFAQEFELKENSEILNIEKRCLQNQLDAEEFLKGIKEKNFNYDQRITELKVYFIKYMYDTYGLPFKLSEDLWNMVSAKNLFSHSNSHDFFYIEVTAFDKILDQRFDYSLGSNLITMFGKIWGLHYVYDFLEKSALISYEAAKLMEENNIYHRNEVIKYAKYDLWQMSFVFTWPQNHLWAEYKPLFSSTFDSGLENSTKLLEMFFSKISIPQRILDIVDRNKASEINKSFTKQTPLKSSAPKIGRNEPCPCGSGKKYKKCCLNA